MARILESIAVAALLVAGPALAQAPPTDPQTKADK